MFGKRWHLFRLLGIPIRVDPSWLLILALLAWSLAGAFPLLLKQYYSETPWTVPPAGLWGMGLVAALTFFGCIVLHELGHAVVARALGTPIRGITLFIFGGVAELDREPTSARDELLIALGGPLVSVGLAALFSLLTVIGVAVGFIPPVVVVLGYLATINLIVLLFNLAPAFPLDGGRVLRSILWQVTGSLRRATAMASLSGQIFGWMLIGLGVLRLMRGDILGGLWMGMVGMFLNNAAQGSYRNVLLREVLRGEPVRRVMTPDPIVVAPSLDLRTWVEEYVSRYSRKAFPVVTDGVPQGLIETTALAEIPREHWDRHTVGEMMRHNVAELSISVEADAVQAIDLMNRFQTSRLMVTDGGRLVGILSLNDVLRLVELKMELEDEVPNVPRGPSTAPGLVDGVQRTHPEALNKAP